MAYWQLHRKEKELPVNAIPFLHLLRSVTGHQFHCEPVTIQQMTGKVHGPVRPLSLDLYSW